jgi:hypothetical protein
MFLLLIDVFFLFVLLLNQLPTHQQQSDFSILVLYDFIVQSILSSLLLLCYNLMIMNDYNTLINLHDPIYL